MRDMKRRKILIIAIGLAVLLSACGGSSGQDKAAASAGPAAETAGSESKSADPVTDQGENAGQESAADPAGSGQDPTDGSAGSGQDPTVGSAGSGQEVESGETDSEETLLLEEAGTTEIFSEEAKPTGRQDRTAEPAEDAKPDGGKDRTAEPAEKAEQTGQDPAAEEAADMPKARLLYMGQASIRITTPEGKVIYIDPYCGSGYEPAADLILITHDHYDHNAPDLVANRNPGCRTITWKEALADGQHQTFDLGFARVEAVEAGYNSFHDVNACVGYIVTLSDGISIYVTGDTSTTQQMPALAEKEIDYAFYCCDGVYNMDLDEAARCAEMVGAKHNIPYHMLAQDGVYFDRDRAEQFDAPDRLIIGEGEEIELTR